MKLTHLQMKFGDKTVLSDVNLSVQKGERIAILGGNGCGKTTLLNIINKGLVATSGKIDYENFNLTNHNRCYIMQHETLPSELKVVEALKLFAQNKESLTEGRYLAEKFDLTKNLNKRFSKLSGGEKQKLFLISSLQNSPEYFFLDEITTGLDYNSRDDLLTFLAEVFEQKHDTLFLVTHYIEEAIRLCNRFVVIKNGQIAEDFTRDNLIERDFSLVKFDEKLLNFDEELVSASEHLYKVSKENLPEIMRANFDHIVSYERDFTRNLGEIIAE